MPICKKKAINKIPLMRLADEDNLYKLYLAYNAFAESFGQNEAAEAAFEATEAALDTRIL
jgi:hypothetical protein